MGRARVNVTVSRLELNAEGLEAKDVHVDLAGTQVATARHCHDGLAKAREKRTEHRGGGTHLDDEVIGRLPLAHIRGVNDERVLVHDVDGGPKTLEHLAHHVHVRDVGHVRERVDARSHDRGCHELEGGVLGSLYADLAGDGMPTLDLDDVHVPPTFVCICQDGRPSPDAHQVYPKLNCRRASTQMPSAHRPSQEADRTKPSCSRSRRAGDRPLGEHRAWPEPRCRPQRGHGRR